MSSSFPIIKLNISSNHNIWYLTLKHINRVFPFKHFSKQRQVLYNYGGMNWCMTGISQNEGLSS